MSTATLTVRATPGSMSVGNSGLVPDHPADDTKPRNFVPCNRCLNGQVTIKQYPGFQFEAECIHCGHYQNPPRPPVVTRNGYHRANPGRLVLSVVA